MKIFSEENYKEYKPSQGDRIISKRNKLAGIIQEQLKEDSYHVKWIFQDREVDSSNNLEELLKYGYRFLTGDEALETLFPPVINEEAINTKQGEVNVPVVSQELLDAIETALEGNEFITNKTWRSTRGIQDSQKASTELAGLVKAGVLRVEGRKRGTKYFKV